MDVPPRAVAIVLLAWIEMKVYPEATENWCHLLESYEIRMAGRLAEKQFILLSRIPLRMLRLDTDSFKFSLTKSMISRDL
jgi:hypothetical protein